MFHPRPATEPHRKIERFLDWLKGYESGPAQEIARRQLREAADHIPVLEKYYKTPQGAPWHVEGRHVNDHVERMLFVLEVVVQGGSLLDIEEFAREKDLVLEVKALEETLRTHHVFLRAFALAHDVAKPDLLTFDAKAHTKGAAEGFAGKRQPTVPELTRYDKLLRAFAVGREQLPLAVLLTAFFEEYGIETHYDQHSPRAASPEYAPVREAIMQHVRLPLSYAKILAEIVRYHIDVLFDVTTEKYRLIAARAGKMGLNVDLMLDLTLAHVFIDAVAGSLSSSGAQTHHVIAHMRAEREAFPQRHIARELAKQRKEKQAQKDILAVAGLEGEEVFRLLGTPIGPERGTVMRHIQDALKDPTITVNLGLHSPEIARRIAIARERLSPRA